MTQGETIVTLEAHTEVSLRRVCRISNARPTWVAELVAHGVVEPLGPRPTRWRFDDRSLARLLRARRLERDLGLNPAGIALAMELSDELRRLRDQIRHQQLPRSPGGG
ncbi:MAG TPA: chaperone modulator CbpM [Pseudomonadales bacterium]|nr:chaperone modulator CbpM [Pseudomonadales bacterium]